jgi:hypothetical protein
MKEQMGNEHTTHAEYKAGHKIFSLAPNAAKNQKSTDPGDTFAL